MSDYRETQTALGRITAKRLAGVPLTRLEAILEAARQERRDQRARAEQTAFRMTLAELERHANGGDTL